MRQMLPPARSVWNCHVFSARTLAPLTKACTRDRPTHSPAGPPRVGMVSLMDSLIEGPERFSTIQNGKGEVPRRALVKSAAWTVPVVAAAVAAPIASASPCTFTYPGTVVFGGAGSNYTRGANNSTTAASASVALGAGITPVGVTFAAAVSGSTYALRPANLSVATVSGIQTLWLEQTVRGAQEPTTAPDRGQLLTVTFDRPVTDVTLRLEDMTRATTMSTFRYSDTVVITPGAGTMSEGVKGSDTAGSGTAADPWRTTVHNPVVPTINTATSVRDIVLSGPLTSFTLRYFSTQGGTSAQAQAILLPNFTFTARREGC